MKHFLSGLNDAKDILSDLDNMSVIKNAGD